MALRLVHPNDPRHEEVSSALQAFRSNGDDLYLTPQILREFWAVSTRAINVGGYGLTSRKTETLVLRLLITFLFLDDETGIFSTWFDLVAKHHVEGAKVHNANLAAAARHHNLTHVLTLNEKDFKRYALSGLQTLTPHDLP